jgi:hypothetical protein
VPHWWEGLSAERYWCETSHRQDVGTDLKCPQTDERGRPFWSYSLIREILPGDIVFHYSPTVDAFIGASVAGGPLEERDIVWTPSFKATRAQVATRRARPGWWLPLYGFRRASTPLTLERLREPQEQQWIHDWMNEKKREFGTTASPFHIYRRLLRGVQAYITKVPLAFVNRWPQLSQLEDALAEREEELVRLNSSLPSAGSQTQFRPRSEQEYATFISGGIQRRSRRHERLVRLAAERLHEAGATVSNPHPRDLLVTDPVVIIFEAKIVGSVDPIFAVREAVGQLFEYRYFVGPREAELCILLDAAPREGLVRYVENFLGLFIVWLIESEPGLRGGPRTADRLSRVGVTQ